MLPRLAVHLGPSGRRLRLEPPQHLGRLVGDHGPDPERRGTGRAARGCSPSRRAGRGRCAPAARRTSGAASASRSRGRGSSRPPGPASASASAAPSRSASPAAGPVPAAASAAARRRRSSSPGPGCPGRSSRSPRAPPPDAARPARRTASGAWSRSPARSGSAASATVSIRRRSVRTRSRSGSRSSASSSSAAHGFFQEANSSWSRSARSMVETRPLVLAVRRRSRSWTQTRCPSAVSRTSHSSASAPSRSACT